MQIRVGTNHRNSGGDVYNVERTIIHPEYLEDEIILNDIGLIRVQGGIKYTKKVQPIRINKEPVPPGTLLMITGWGRLGVSFYTLNFRQKKPKFLQIKILY